MKTIDFDPTLHTLTFVADDWVDNFDFSKEVIRKKRIEKILSNLNDKERTKSTIL